MAARALPDRSFFVLSIVGTRPEAIKMAPVVRSLGLRPAIRQRIFLTGQHAGLAAGFEGVPVDALSLDLREHSPAELRETLTHAACRYLARERPDLVVVQGDTTSALAGALAARDCGVPIAHVEAGLRSHQLEPWPEEDNRVAIDALADLLFAPTDAAAANLAAERRVTGAVHVTGNSGIDALFHAGKGMVPILAPDGRKTILATCHRRENQGEPLNRICDALKRLVAEFPVRVLFLLHPNRHLREAVAAKLGGLDHIALTEAVGHERMVRLMRQSWILLTDSGGLQEEGTTLGLPVLVTREVTERIEAGANIELVGTDPVRIVAAVNRLLMDEVHYARMSHPALPFGDGHAGPRIAALIEDWLAGKAAKRA